MRSDRCRYITAPIRISSSVSILCLLPGSINTWLGFAVSECGGSFLIKVSESWKSPWKVRVATLLRSFKLVSTLNEISWPSASWLSGDPRMESFKCHYTSWKCHLSSSGLKNKPQVCSIVDASVQSQQTSDGPEIYRCWDKSRALHDWHVPTGLESRSAHPSSPVLTGFCAVSFHIAHR